MNEQELRRLKADVTTLQEVIGSPLPFGRSDLWLTLLCIPCGAFLATGAALVPWEHVRWLLLPLIVSLVLCILQRYRYRRTTGRSGIRRREYSLGLMLGVLSLTAYWFISRGFGFSREAVGTTALFFIGLMTLSWALLDRRRVACIGAAVPLMALGASIPFTTARQFVVIAGIALIAGGLISGTIMAWQLRQQPSA